MSNFDFDAMPGFLSGSPPQYLAYHEEVDFLDELEVGPGRDEPTYRG